MKNKICENCGKYHEGTFTTGRFCSKECAKAYSTKNEIKGQKKELPCSKCNKIIIVGKRSDPKKITCEYCKSKSIRFQTKDLLSVIQTGLEDNSLSKDWNKKQENIINNEYEYKFTDHSRIVGQTTKGKYKINPKSILELSARTISKIIQRLGLGCSICGWNESSCDIHHINGKNVDDCNGHWNLTILCPNCHRLVHTHKIKSEDLKSIEWLGNSWIDYYYG